MKETAPEYYSRFSCIADRCRHTCCAGWEIDIDPDSLERYESMPGPLGDKLRSRIRKEQECASFIMTEDERCPFLQENGLCELIVTKGDGILCQICRDHPRFWNELSDRNEMGLGFCCEEACRLILENEEPMRMVVTDPGEGEDPEPEEQVFLDRREALWARIADRSLPVTERIRQLAADAEINWLTDTELLKRFLLTLECMDPAWQEHVRKMDGAVLYEKRTYPKEIEIALEQLMAALIYRHYTRILDGETEQEVLKWIIRMWQTVLMAARTEGDMTLRELEETVRMFSGEIEYSDENPQMLTEFLNCETTEFEDRVYAYVRSIPKGKVATYGDVAKAIGCPGGARAVGNALHRNPDPDWTPCFRILNSRGETAEHFGDGGREGQKRRLEEDGIRVVDGKVELGGYRVKGEGLTAPTSGSQDGEPWLVVAALRTRGSRR